MPDTPSVHHINYVVKDLAKNVAYLSTLLNQQPIYESIETRGVNTARFRLTNIWLVLVQPTSPKGEVARILTQRGEGLFLLSLSTQNLEESLLQLEKQNLTASAKGPRNGLLNWLVHDLNTPSGLGPILQLCQETPTNKNSSY